MELEQEQEPELAQAQEHREVSVVLDSSQQLPEHHSLEQEVAVSTRAVCIHRVNNGQIIASTTAHAQMHHVVTTHVEPSVLPTPTYQQAAFLRNPQENAAHDLNVLGLQVP